VLELDPVELDLGVLVSSLIDLDDSHRHHLTRLVSASGGRGRGVRPQSQPSDRGWAEEPHPGSGATLPPAP